jgi:hypothetical protein
MVEPASPPTRLVLRDLPLAARLTLAVFLISVAIGYASALVQLHFQHASPGNLLPTADDAERVFVGRTPPRPLSKLELLLLADEKQPFNGTGQMSAAFTRRCGTWKGDIKKKARALKLKTPDGGLDLEAAEKALRQERDTERLAVVEWARSGASKEDYDRDQFPLPDALKGKPVDKQFRAAARPNGAECVKVRSILKVRCARCHAPEGEDAKAAQYPLDTFERLQPYLAVKEGASTAMSLTKLAQSTHTHLLGFATLYGLTGLIFAFSSYPRVIRVVLAPLPLAVQVADISFWWLARLDAPYGPMFAHWVIYSGAIVAAGLALHIVLGLFNLFGWRGKVVLVLLFAAAAAGGYVAKEKVIDPYLAKEAAPAATAE